MQVLILLSLWISILPQKFTKMLFWNFRFVILKYVRRDLIPNLPLPRRILDYLSTQHYYSEHFIEEDQNESPPVKEDLDQILSVVHEGFSWGMIIVGSNRFFSFLSAGCRFATLFYIIFSVCRLITEFNLFFSIMWVMSIEFQRAYESGLNLGMIEHCKKKFFKLGE